MTPQDIERLELYVDGALDPAEAAEVERLVASDPAWRDAHAALTAIGGLLRAHLEERAAAADLGDLWSRIEAELPPDAAAPAPRPLGERIRAWWAAHWTPVLVSAAAAAAVAFVVVRALAPPAADPAEPRVADGQPSSGAALVPVGDEVVVESVRSDGNKTVLISQPAADDGATVIWLLDEERGDAGAPPDGEDPI